MNENRKRKNSRNRSGEKRRNSVRKCKRRDSSRAVREDGRGHTESASGCHCSKNKSVSGTSGRLRGKKPAGKRDVQLRKKLWISNWRIDGEGSPSFSCDAATMAKNSWCGDEGGKNKGQMETAFEGTRSTFFSRFVNYISGNK